MKIRLIVLCKHALLQNTLAIPFTTICTLFYFIDKFQGREFPIKLLKWTKDDFGPNLMVRVASFHS